MHSKKILCIYVRFSAFLFHLNPFTFTCADVLAFNMCFRRFFFNSTLEVLFLLIFGLTGFVFRLHFSHWTVLLLIATCSIAASNNSRSTDTSRSIYFFRNEKFWTSDWINICRTNITAAHSSKYYYRMVDCVD